MLVCHLLEQHRLKGGLSGWINGGINDEINPSLPGGQAPSAAGDAELVENVGDMRLDGQRDEQAVDFRLDSFRNEGSPVHATELAAWQRRERFLISSWVKRLPGSA
jgi:hypothetical protein